MTDEHNNGTTPELRLHRTLQEVHRTLERTPTNYDSISLPSEDSPLFTGTPSSAFEFDQVPKVEPRGSSLRTKILAAILVAGFMTTAMLLVQVHTERDVDESILDAIDIPMLGKSKSRAMKFAKIGERYLSNPTIGKVSHHEGELDVLKTPEGCEATVMLVRHCDKGTIQEHCDYLGYERAVYLSSLFGDEDERWPSPSYVFALAPGGRHNPEKHNFREVETVQPLAEKVNVTVDESFTTHHTSRLAKHLLGMMRSGEMCGKLAVVDWKHSDIPHLAHKLGCGPSRGCPLDYPSETFDQVWQIKYVYKKLWHSTRKNGKVPRDNKWLVFGSVLNQGFDPLAFSKLYGDYKPGGTGHGARWSAQAEEVTEAYVRSINKNE